MKKKLKKMHFLFIYFLIMLLASCIAEDNFQIDSINNEIYKTEIVDYFDKLKKVSNSLQLSKIKELENVVNLNSARLYDLRTSEKLIIVDLNKQEGLETTESSKLIFYVNDGKIARSNLVSIVNKASYYDYDKMILSILNMSEDKPNFSGTISFYSLFQDKLLVDEFENGELTVNGILNRNIKKKFISKAKKCTDWYWLTTYSDGSQTLEYAFTECDGGGNECVSYKTGKVMCGGGGGGENGVGIGTIPSSGPSFPANPQNNNTYPYTDKEGITTLYKYNSQTNKWEIIEVILPSIVIQNSPEYYYYLIIIYPVDNQKVTGPDGFVYTYEGASGNWVGEPISRSKAGEIEDKIDESQLDLCSKNVLAKLKAATQSDIAAMINHFAPAGSIFNINMTIGQVRNNDPNIWAQTTKVIGSSTDINVIFNQAYINGTGNPNRPTDLSIATTMAHEVIHAYLISLLEQNLSCGASGICDFPTVYEAYVQQQITKNKSILPEAHHELIARNFVYSIAATIQEFHTGQAVASGFPRQVYLDMALGGLTGTIYFNKNYPDDKNHKNYNDRLRILARIITERKGEQYGNNTPLGTPCKK
jgi:hypothetical protein